MHKLYMYFPLNILVITMPYTANVLTIQVAGTTVGVVTGLDISLTREGGTVTHVYGSNTGAIATGGDRATFRLQRWFMADTDTDLLYDLFNDKTGFVLQGQLAGMAGAVVSISGCKANTWRLITGDANAIVGEEVSGEGVGWTSTNIT
jgi:hypothetical protein